MPEPHENFYLTGLMLNVLASFAEFERELIATRVAESRALLKARALRIADLLPFGYSADPLTKQLVPVVINDLAKGIADAIVYATEAAVVKWMFDEAAAGKRPAEIAAAANANGWRTKSTFWGEHGSGVAPIRGPRARSSQH
jgi:DNA invertase Pin-like site-specific DNA recombinase